MLTTGTVRVKQLEQNDRRDKRTIATLQGENNVLKEKIRKVKQTTGVHHDIYWMLNDD